MAADLRGYYACSLDDASDDVTSRCIELFRSDCKDDPAHMNKKIKQAQRDQVPFMLIAGEREQADGTVAIRRRGTREQEVVPFEEFLDLVRRLRGERAAGPLASKEPPVTP